jgi:hypothetical protein
MATTFPTSDRLAPRRTASATCRMPGPGAVTCLCPSAVRSASAHPAARTVLPAPRRTTDLLRLPAPQRRSQVCALRGRARYAYGCRAPRRARVRPDHPRPARGRPRASVASNSKALDGRATPCTLKGAPVGGRFDRAPGGIRTRDSPDFEVGALPTELRGLGSRPGSARQSPLPAGLLLMGCQRPVRPLPSRPGPPRCRRRTLRCDLRPSLRTPSC